VRPADIAIIVALVLVVGAIGAYLVKNRKKGGCASCPYANSCQSRKDHGGCPDNKKKRDEDGQDDQSKK